MAETKQGFLETPNLYMYQELESGNISAAIGLDEDDDTWKLSVQPDVGANPNDLPTIQINPVGNITFLPSGVFELVGSQTATGTITAQENIIAQAGLNNASGNSFDLQKSRLGGVITTGDTLGSLVFAGHDGTDYITASQIKSVNSGTVATNRIASNLLFYTHPDSTSSSTLRMTIAPTGAITIAAPDSGTGLTVSGGGITASAGNIAASTGSVSAGTTVTSGTTMTCGTGLTVTTGGITSTGTTTLSSLGNGIMRTNGSGVVSSTNGSNGQLLIGGGTNAAWANLTSSGGTITITNGANTINLEATASGFTTVHSDSGNATVSGGAFTISGGSNLNSTGSGSTIVVNLDNTVSISGSMTAGTGFTATTGNVAISNGNLTMPNTNAAGTQGVITKGGTRWASNYGTNNTFVGQGSGNTTLTTGSAIENNGFGYSVLDALTTGQSNSGFGKNTLTACTSGDNNSSFGNAGLLVLTTGSRNSTLGREAGVQLVTGSDNLLLGYEAGRNYTGSESSNIMLANNGTVGDNTTIRIGATATHTECHIAGIAGVTVSSSAAVLINTSNGQLGTIVSARKYKYDINPIGKSSVNLLDLEPVQFRYINDEAKELHYGLIADDVMNLYPDLVIYNDKHEPETVKYHELPAMLLNELKRAMRRIDRLEHLIEDMRKC
jgi:Chaperone of endosialidase